MLGEKMVDENFVPMYREPRSMKDVHHNTQQMILTFNHNTTAMNKNIKTLTESSIRQGQDIKWMKRAVFAVCGLLCAALIMTILESMGIIIS